MRESEGSTGWEPLVQRRVVSGARFWKEGIAEEPVVRSVEAPGIAEVLSALSAELAELLGQPSEPIDVRAPLATLGVDSLALFSLLQRLEVRYRVTIPLEAVLQPGATPRSVAELVASAPTPAPTPPVGAPAAISMFAPRAADALEGLAPSARELAATSAYTLGTVESKQHAQRFRAVLADNRNIAGFRPRTKERTYPIVAERAKGARIWDADGVERIDLTMGFGVHLFGHAPEFIHAAVVDALAKGAPIGPQSPVAGEVAALLAAMTGLDRFTFTNSGTEAVMLACRLARAATHRQRIVVFEGSYHGTFDGVLGFGGGAVTRPITAGTPNGMVADLVVLPWADRRALAYIKENGASLAAILVEPVQSRNPGVQPREFLHALRGLATEAGVALIFDEVITGFRCGLGGAQAHFDVRADLAVYGKVVGGGFPIGVVGGSARFLARIDGGFWSFGDGSAPSYDLVFFAGTFNKHPVAMAAARAALTRLRDSGDALLASLSEGTAGLCVALNEAFLARGCPLQAVWFGSLFRLQSARNLDGFFARLNGAGLYVWEGRTLFLSEAHTEADLAVVRARILQAADEEFGADIEGATVTSWPLSPAQRRFLAAPATSLAGNVGFAVRLGAGLNSGRLQAALRAVLARHEILRGRVDRAAGLVHLGQGSTARVLAEASPANADDVATRLGALAREPVDVEQGPLATFLVLDHGELGVTFAVATHGVVLDGVSLAVLFYEVACVYDGRPLGQPPQYRDYLAFVEAREAEGAAAGRHFWSALMPVGVPEPLFDAGPGTRAAGRVRREIGNVAFGSVVQAARRAGVTRFVYLFSCFTLALARQFGGRPLVIAVPVADRRFAGGDSIVGNLTLLMVVPQDVGQAETLAARLAFNAVLLPRCTEHAASSWGARVGEGGQGAPQVLFNLEPGHGLPKLGGVVAHEVDFPRPEATFVVSAHVLLAEDGLRVNLDFLEGVIARDRVEALADAFLGGGL